MARQQATGALQAHAYDQPEVVAGPARWRWRSKNKVAARRTACWSAWAAAASSAAWPPGLQTAPTWWRWSPNAHPPCTPRAAGHPVDVEVGGVAADSLGARRIGALCWEISQRHVHDALLLPDDAIRAAQLWLWKEFKLAVEPAAALGLAALQTGAYCPSRKRRWPDSLRRQL